jgi:nucleoside-diphosphate-sugar epimerase
MVRTTYGAEELRELVAPLEVDAVIHAAGSGVDPGRRAPGELVAGNLTLTENVLSAFRGHGIAAFVNVGSCSEYAPVADGQLVTESTELLPTSVYGGLKAATSLLARALASQYSIPFVGVRLFGAYGPGEAPYRLLPYLCARLCAGQDVDLTPGDQIRDLTYVDDVAEGLIRLAQAPPDDGFVNLCSGRGTRVRDVALLAATALEADPELLRFGARTPRGDEPRWLVGSPAKLRTRLGWTPPTPLEEGVAATCYHLRAAAPAVNS